MSSFPTVLVDQAHSSAWALERAVATTMNPANPADASLERAATVLRAKGFQVAAHTDGRLSPEALQAAQVLVIAHPADARAERVVGTLPPVFTDDEVAAIEAFVRSGGGLVVLAECDQDTSGNNLNTLLGRFGLGVRSTVVHEPAEGGGRHQGNATWVLGRAEPGLGQGLLAGVEQVCFYRCGTIEIAQAPQARVLHRSGPTADPAHAPLAVALTVDAGRVVVLADSDLIGDDSIGELDHTTYWANVVAWASNGGRQVSGSGQAVSTTTQQPAWRSLKAAVEQLRLLQSADGSIDTSVHDTAPATALVAQIRADIAALAPLFPHDADYLAALPVDLQRWVDGGFAVPDFLDSLMAFRPDLCRRDGIEHLVVFPMYTQNGNPDRVFEAVLLSVQWPQWLAQVEASYDNPMFLAVNFLDFTPGYDTNSAVLFPETVAVREVPKFSWGAIFCDREGARFRRVVREASELLRLQLPPEAERLVASQELAQSTFAMWDLIHDRTHSHGDLPFDPFMIKQRMPFWMYALEELRCDLNTFRQCVDLQQAAHPYAGFVQYAIVFDRLFRFPITGERLRNYDGLGGQLLFAYLHRHDALRWSDNALSFDWRRVPEVVVALCEDVERLYRSGIDRSRVGHWLAAYAFVSEYVAPHPASTWAQGAQHLPLDGTTKELVDLVQPDEFPLNVFYEALRKKMAPVIASTAGITANDGQPEAAA